MSDRPSRLRPLHLGLALGAIVVLALLFAPDIQYGTREGALTTYNAGHWGARGFYQTLERLGWPVERRLRRFEAPVAAGATYLFLNPPIPPGARETGVLLEAVRQGARVLVVPRPDTPLSDSLGIRVASGMAYGAIATGRFEDGAEVEVVMHHWLAPTDRTERPLPEDAERLLTIERRNQVLPAALGLRIGDGRLLLIADAAFLSNHRLRELDEAVVAVRLIEWLEGEEGRRPVVFSEWHQGRGIHPSPMGVFWSALIGTAPGRVLAVLLFAGAALLVAVSARPVAPLPVTRIERRSPFEHVDALSRAYQQIGGTRLATRHLVRGLLRRRSVGTRSVRGEREYLEAVRDRFPALQQEIATVLDALDRRLAPQEFVKVGEAMHNIERTLTQ